MKKILLFFSFVLLILTPVYADSGWDSGTGGGYSTYDVPSYSSSDSGGGSSYSPSSRGSSSRRGFPLSNTIALLIALISATMHPKKDVNRGEAGGTSFSHPTEDTILDHSQDDSNEISERKKNYDKVIQKYLPNYTEEMLLQEFYDIFVNIQEAWMKFDYKTLEKYCSNELYESYYMDLEVLKKKHGKNMMSDFTLLSYNIRNIEEVHGRVVIDMFLKVSFKDYVVDTKKNKIIHGDSEVATTKKYDLEYVMDLDSEIDKKKVCPNCGAKLHGRECEFCHTIVDTKKDHFVLNKKGIIR